MRSSQDVKVVSVFATDAGGGNPAPIVINAAGMTDAEMQHVAQTHGNESGFAFPAPSSSGCDFEFRFWVPNHEMSMCGHATVGTVWLLDQAGQLPRDHLSILTKSGRVDARILGRTVHGATVEISQPLGTVEALPEPELNKAEILDVLGISESELASHPIWNACTSRVKTLIPLANTTILDELQPDFRRMEELCEKIGSTGLYPYAAHDRDEQVFDARQFPKSSGYPEDAATGIAAAALSFGLLANGEVESSERLITIRQGRAMRRPSQISVRFRLENGRPAGCWLGGSVRIEETPS